VGYCSIADYVGLLLTAHFLILLTLRRVWRKKPEVLTPFRGVSCHEETDCAGRAAVRGFGLHYDG
jgi:hypothetical protein